MNIETSLASANLLDFKPVQGDLGLPDARVIARVRAHGAEPVGEVVQYENKYRLAYIRGPEGIIVGLSEQIGPVG